MLSLLLHTLISVCILTVPAHVSAVTTETVVGVAGRRVTLPCRVEVVSQGGVEVCWGRGEPSLFTCHNAVINTAGDQTTYRKSYRAQLPGPFNDQTSTVHLIIIKPHSVVSEPSHREDAGNLNTPQTPAVFTSTDVTEQTGSDVTGDNTTGPMVALVQSSVQQLVHSLQIYIGNTVRVSFIIFIPALLLTAAHRVWRANQRAETDQSEEEADSSV
uniref:hepatitis A virus cellular receptor 1-like isoform X2 n=1 Tax=Semicossyphus pulcher TaxID=241346 RepID=UPI0037E8D175